MKRRTKKRSKTVSVDVNHGTDSPSSAQLHRLLKVIQIKQWYIKDKTFLWTSSVCCCMYHHFSTRCDFVSQTLQLRRRNLAKIQMWTRVSFPIETERWGRADGDPLCSPFSNSGYLRWHWRSGIRTDAPGVQLRVITQIKPLKLIKKMQSVGSVNHVWRRTWSDSRTVLNVPDKQTCEHLQSKYILDCYIADRLVKLFVLLCRDVPACSVSLT